MIFESKDLLINWKKTPDEDSQEFLAFWESERNKCKNGITIDGVFINPFLYWHCNLWTIISDHITKGRIRQKPDFRDSEWLLTNKIWEAETWKNEEGLIRKKGVVAAGTRRFSKSVLEASFCAWKGCNWKNSQIVVSGGNEADIKIVTDMIDLGINELPNYYMKSKVEDNWKKQVTLGYKDSKSNQRQVWSTFAIRNFDGGNNEEALAGLTPDGGIIDEGGKYKFLKALLAGLPGLTTANGWRGSFLVMGTGGDMDNFQDFQTLFDDPESYNFLACDIPDENRRCGIFLPGWMSYAYPKSKQNLATHLGLEEVSHPNLANIEILVADKDKNERLIDEERVLAAKSLDQSALLKTTMYFPKNTREIFLASSHNNFPIEACKMQQIYLREECEFEYIDLYRDQNNTLNKRFSTLKPIQNFPVKPADFKDAPIVIYEYPQEGLIRGAYCAGIDCYNKNESSDRINSLGVIYIYKRMYDPLGKYQNEIVASYRGRPSDIKKFYEICFNLIEFYNAVALPELNERFYDFFANKRKSHYIHNAIQLAKEIANGNTFAKGSDKGLPPTTRNQRYGMELSVQYTIEDLISIDDTENSLPKMGVSRIHDDMLLEEFINYRGKVKGAGVHDGNFDSIVAFYHCLILAQHLDKMQPLHFSQKVDNEEVKKPPKVKFPWGTADKQFNPFGTAKPRNKRGSNRQFL